MFFVDKYAITDYDKSLFHKDSITKLKQMSQDNRLSHLIFYGPEGSGKKTLIKLLLELTFDKSVHDTRERIYAVNGSGNAVNNISIEQSNHHIIIEPNNNNSDKYLMDVVKEYAKIVPLNIFKARKPFKIVVINNLDCMSYYAQTSLRRTMEKYSDTCRFVMWCKSLTKVIDPLISRCYCFKVPAPSDGDIFKNLIRVSALEKLKKLEKINNLENMSLTDYISIVSRSKNNIKTSLWLLQLKALGQSYNTSYDKALNTIIKHVLNSSIEEINRIREILYTIMITNIPGSTILKDLLKKILDDNKISFEVKAKLIKIAAKYEHNLIRGRREIIHIDGFISHSMAVIAGY